LASLQTPSVSQAIQLKPLDSDSWQYSIPYIWRQHLLKASKIVEVMVGGHPWVAQSLKEKLPNTSVIATDIDKEKIDSIKRTCPTLEVIQDNIVAPRFETYEEAGLKYSIRPPRAKATVKQVRTLVDSN